MLTFVVCLAFLPKFKVVSILQFIDYSPIVFLKRKKKLLN